MSTAYPWGGRRSERRRGDASSSIAPVKNRSAFIDEKVNQKRSDANFSPGRTGEREEKEGWGRRSKGHRGLRELGPVGDRNLFPRSDAVGRARGRRLDKWGGNDWRTSEKTKVALFCQGRSEEKDSVKHLGGS